MAKYFPLFIDISNKTFLVIGVTSSGSNHKLARRVASAIRYNIKDIVEECRREQEENPKQEDFD